MTAALVEVEADDTDLPIARVLPPRPATLEEALSRAVDHLEEFLIDVYVRRRSVPAPEVMWAHGARDMLATILDCLSHRRMTAR